MQEHTQKASKRNKNTAALQLQLWNSGAFNGVIDKKTGKQITYERAVDGIMGKMTRQAMENNKQRRDSIKINIQPRQQKTQSNKKSLKFVPQDEQAYDKAVESFVGNKNKSDGSTYLSRFIDNLYPYGYQDNPGTATFGGFFKKTLGGFVGPSERRKHLNSIIDLDLNDPEQLKQANEHRNAFDNFLFSDIKDIQLSARLRDDLNRLYTGRPQKYNSFMVNPDFELGEAKALGVPTYTFSDPKLRKQYQQSAYNFNKSQQIGKSRASDNQKDVFNRFTITKSNDDNSGYYREKWDLLNYPGKDIYVADTIPSNIGGKSKFRASIDNTPQGVIEYIKHLF